MVNQNGSFVDESKLVLAWGTVRYATFPDRVCAAAEAGITCIGLSVGYYQELLASGWTDTDISSVLAEYGVSIDEVEVLFGFAASPGPANIPARPNLVYADPVVEQTAFHMADVFGVRRVQAVGAFELGRAGDEAVSRFAAVCDRAAVHEMQVALEFVPYTNIPDIAQAYNIVERAGRENGGVCIDSWHFFRGSQDFGTLATLDTSRVFMIQLNDGTIATTNETRMAEAVHIRRCPGDGDFDLVSFLRALDRPGLNSALSLEVYSDDLDRMSTKNATHNVVSSTRSLLASRQN